MLPAAGVESAPVPEIAVSMRLPIPPRWRAGPKLLMARELPRLAVCRGSRPRSLADLLHWLVNAGPTGHTSPNG